MSFMKNVLLHRVLFFFLWGILCYHLAHTFFVFGRWRDLSTVSVVKDILWIFLIVWALVYYRSHFFWFFQKYKVSLLLFVGICIRSVWLSLVHWWNMHTLMIGIKYDLWPLGIVLSALFLWYTQRKTSYSSLVSYMSPSIRIIGIVLLVWLLRQCAKIWVPDFFARWWYGPVGDYVVWQHPPIYYRTWPGGTMRLQGIFAWPNNFGFFLVAFASVILYMVSIRWQKKVRVRAIAFFVLYAVCVIWTFSRWVLVWVGIQCFFLSCLLWPRWRKYMVWLWVLWVFWLWVMSIWKWWSTVAHIFAWEEGIHAFLSNPRWYGLGSAGPAVHRNGVYLPENHYLQILLDIGIPWLVLRIGVLYTALWSGASLKQAFTGAICIDNTQRMLCLLLWLWLVWLLAEWLFLHVFEDSMVNYLFLVPLWYVFGRRGV